MIKILHIVSQIGVGGAEGQLLELMMHSDPAKVRHQVLYYCDCCDVEMLRRYKENGIDVCRVPRNNRRPIRFLRDLSRAVRRAQADIVHCWLISANFWGRLASVLAGAKHIILAWRSCDMWKPFVMRICEKLTTHRVHHFANSMMCAKYIGGMLGLPARRFTVIHNGIDCRKYGISAGRKEVFGDIGVPDDARIVTMVGRLTRAKNYPMLLRTAGLCRDRGLPVHFVVVGHGDAETRIKDLASELKVQDIVHFLGLRSDVARVLAASDMFCFTSDWEGFPNALLEAMASGLPVVASDFRGVRELIAAPEYGVVVPLNDANAAADAIEFYLRNPSLARSTGENAQRFVRSRFGMSSMVEQTVQLYENILAPQPRHASGQPMETAS